MKQTIGPMLCKLNTEQVMLRKRAEHIASAEAAARAAAKREAIARKKREEAQRREREEAQRKEREQAAARKRQQEEMKARASAAGKTLRSTVKTVLAIMAMVLLLSAVIGVAYGLDQGLTYVIDRIPFLWKDATCTEPAVNVLTKDTRGEAAGHSYPICAICGENHREAKDHFWDPSNCTEDGVCSVCGETVQARGHDFVIGQGNVYGYCMACGTMERVFPLTKGAGEDFFLNGWRAYYHELDRNTPLLNSVTLEISGLYTGHPVKVYIRTTAGKWTPAGQFTPTKDSYVYTIDFDAPTAFSAVSVVPGDAQSAYDAEWLEIQEQDKTPLIGFSVTIDSAQADASVAAAAVAEK